MKRLLLCLILLGSLADGAEEPVRVIFAGSSSMDWNDLPREVAKVVKGKVAGRIRAAFSSK